MSSALLSVLKIVAIFCGSRSKPAPAPRPTMHFAEQPMFTSMMSGLRSRELQGRGKQPLRVVVKDLEHHWPLVLGEG